MELSRIFIIFAATIFSELHILSTAPPTNQSRPLRYPSSPTSAMSAPSGRESTITGQTSGTTSSSSDSDSTRTPSLPTGDYDRQTMVTRKRPRARWSSSSTSSPPTWYYETQLLQWPPRQPQLKVYYDNVKLAKEHFNNQFARIPGYEPKFCDLTAEQKTNLCKAVARMMVNMYESAMLTPPAKKDDTECKERRIENSQEYKRTILCASRTVYSVNFYTASGETDVTTTTPVLVSAFLLSSGNTDVPNSIATYTYNKENDSGQLRGFGLNFEYEKVPWS